MSLLFKLFKKVVMALGILLIIIGILIGLRIFDLWYENNYKSHVQTLKMPDKNLKFILLTDLAGFGDRSWYVYKLPLNSSLTAAMYTAHDTNEVLFWNYSEAGDHYDDPNLKIVNDHFLVFSRGGAYHSLFDIDNEEVLVNEESPWAGYLQERESKNLKTKLPPHNILIKELQDWVQKNLHSRIEEILAKGKK